MNNSRDGSHPAGGERVMLDRYGWERYLRDTGAKQLQADDYGTLVAGDLGAPRPPRAPSALTKKHSAYCICEPLVMVELVK